MTAVDLASSLIASGLVDNAAFHAAARRCKTTFAAVKAEYNYRQKNRRVGQVFVYSENDLARQRRELEAWNSGATMTEAERAYYGRGRM